MKLRLPQPGIAVAMMLATASIGAGHAAEEIDVRRDPTVLAIEQVMPSVVNIATRTVVPVRDGFEALNRWLRGQRPVDTFVSLGSGVIIDEAGYLLTNDHVVRRADQIGIKLNTGTNVYEAVVIDRDPRRDIALLKIRARPGEKFRAIKLAREDDLLLGETVLALGNPYGLGGSVSRGILSSKSRTMPKEGAALDIPNWLQTDAPINQGNSGGPLVNLRGELIGINVAVLNQTAEGEPVQGIGFAIPIRLVEEALSDILPTEYVKSFWFGARVKVGNLPLVVSGVQPESPAGRAGLRVGDAILRVNGREPKSFIEFSELLGTSTNASVSLAVRRGDEDRTLPVRLVPARDFFNADLIRERLGLALEELTPAMEQRFKINAAEALYISGVQENSPAARAGLQAGMFVTGIDGQMPQDLTSAAKVVYARRRGQPMRIDIVMLQRSGNFALLRPAAVEIAPR